MLSKLQNILNTIKEDQLLDDYSMKDSDLETTIAMRYGNSGIISWHVHIVVKKILLKKLL